MKVVIVVAVDNTGLIGVNNDLPWHCKGDLEHFKKVTSQKNSALLMGINTFCSLKNALVERTVIVLSHNTEKLDSTIAAMDKKYGILDKEWSILQATSLEEILNEEFPEVLGIDTLFVVGGSSVYSQVLEYTDEIVMTIFNKEFSDKAKSNLTDSDVRSYFPDLDYTLWEEVSSSDLNSISGIPLGRIVTFKNKTKLDNVFNFFTGERIKLFELYDGQE